MHLSIGGNTGAVGDRTPAIWFHPKTGVQVATTLNGVANVAKKFRNQKPAVGEWTTFEISQAKKGLSYIFSVSIAGIEVWSKNNAKPQEFSEVQLNASSRWYEAQAGSIKGLLIENKLLGKICQDEKKCLLIFPAQSNPKSGKHGLNGPHAQHPVAREPT